MALEINGKTYILQPIDYLGESPLNSGSYTYELNVDGSFDEPGTLSLKLIV